MRKLLTLFVGVTFALLSGCAQPTYTKRTNIGLGTVVEITVADKDKSQKERQEAISQAFAEISRLEKLFSRFKSTSDISRINANSFIRPVKVSLETIELIEKAVSFAELTDGAFDITVYPLEEIWGFGQREQNSPAVEEEVKAALDKVGYRYIRINKQRQSVFLTRKGMSLDLGAIAKGYAVDKAVQTLKQAGIKQALVNAGGDIYALGAVSKSKGWQVGLQHPRKRKAILATFKIENRAVATSGDYERFIQFGKERYSHILNPRTGLPCQDVPCSVTVLAKDCTTADALATALFVLGPEKGINLVSRLPDTEAIMFSFQGGEISTLTSPGLKDSLSWSNE